MSKKICIDPGHGGAAFGAVAGQLKEKDINLTASLYLGAVLNSVGYEVVFTRSEDVDVSLSERSFASNLAGCSLFISMHCNSHTTPNATGFEVFTSPGQTAADPIATSVLEMVASDGHGLTMRTDPGDGDPDKEARFAVLIGTNAPALLVELEFLSSPHGQALLTDNAMLFSLLDSIAAGVIQSLEV